jgi:chromosome segregation ATPase
MPPMASNPPQGDDRLMQLVQAAVSASLARRTEMNRPKEAREVAVEARARLDALLRERDAGLQKRALLERAREKILEEVEAAAASLATREEELSRRREAALGAEGRVASLERSGAGETELAEARAAGRDARAAEEELGRRVAALAEELRQKRGIDVKVLDEISRVRADGEGMARRLADLERSAEMGPVVQALRAEVDRAREEGRADVTRVARLDLDLRDLTERAARAHATTLHLREALASADADRERLEEALRRERRVSAERQRGLTRRVEELEDRPPAGTDAEAWERARGEFDARLREAARRVAEAERLADEVRSELDNARVLLARATVERQALRARVESLELASIGAASSQLEGLRAELKRTEVERDESRREASALKARIEALQGRNADLERERHRVEEELKDRTEGGFFRRIRKAMEGD